MSRGRWLAALSATGLLSLALAWSADHHLRNFHTVEPGVLYRSGQLSPVGLKLVLQRYRIKTVITLRTVRDPCKPYLDAWEADVCAARGVRHVRILPRVWSLDGNAKRPADEMIREFLEVMGDPANHPVLVHCFAGVHRTGTLCAIYRMGYQNWTADRAIGEMEEYGFEPGPNREPIDAFLHSYHWSE